MYSAFQRTRNEISTRNLLIHKLPTDLLRSFNLTLESAQLQFGEDAGTESGVTLECNEGITTVSLLSKLTRFIAGEFSDRLKSPREISDPGWKRVGSSDGIVAFRLESWSRYADFLEAEIFQRSKRPRHEYIWRGQRRSDWSLSSSLDRFFEQLGLLTVSPDELDTRSQNHLNAFKHAARGRRGTNPPTLDENEWWALGQHFGLATPLLDWTRSPFAAAYFAFEELRSDATSHRAIYALDLTAVQQKNHELNYGASKEHGRTPILEPFDSLSEENPRLVGQGGLFTRSPVGVPVERWVAQQFEGSAEAILFRIEIPEADRVTCLRSLELMNINHVSLFPDLIGASQYANRHLELEAADAQNANLRSHP